MPDHRCCFADEKKGMTMLDNADIPLPSDADIPLPRDADIPLPSSASIPLPSLSTIKLPDDADIPLPNDADIPLPSDASIPLPADKVCLPVLRDLEKQSKVMTWTKSCTKAYTRKVQKVVRPLCILYTGSFH